MAVKHFWGKLCLVPARTRKGEMQYVAIFKYHISRIPNFFFLYILLVATLMLSSQIVKCQEYKYQLETFGTRDGLLSPKIYSLAQSTDRQLWIGSEIGISIFNGYTFQNYMYTSQNETIGRILAISQDSAGGIWVGGDKGLYHYFKNKITKIEFRDRPALAIESLLTDAAGNLWVGDLHFVYKLTAAQVLLIKSTPGTILQTTPFAGLKERAFQFATDRFQNVYMASHGGVFLFPPNQNTYRLLWENPDVNNFVRSVSALSPDSVYLNRNDGHPSQLINGKLKVLFDPQSIGRSTFIHNNKPYAVTTRDVAWIQDGIKPIVSFSRFTNHVHTTVIDSEDNIWLGTWEGLLKFRKNNFSIYSLIEKEHSEVFSFLENSRGELLFGSNEGIVYKKDKNSIIPYEGMPRLFKNAEVLCMVETADGSIWSGSGYEGISRYRNKEVTNFNETGFLMDNNCEALFPVANGQYFACTEFGVTLVDPSQKFPMVAHYDFTRKYSRAPELFGCYEAPGNLYFFYGSQGLFLLKDKKLQEDSIGNLPIKNLYINKIIADKKGLIWVATLGKGLLQCKMENGRIVLLNQLDQDKGLQSNNALSVIADKNDNIWFGDYMSLTQIIHTGNKDQLVTYNEKDGLLSTYYQTLKLEQQKDGTIWGLTTTGVFSFHPDSINNNLLPPVIKLEQVLINGKDEITAFSSTLIPEFPYTANSFQFNFTGISLSDPTKNRYAYRLKGTDSTWNYTANRTISFNSLSPGMYLLEIKAGNNSNVWTRPIQYNFIINPPFWRTKIFILAIVLLIAGIFYLFLKQRVKVVKAKEAIKQQMAELESKALRAQMNPHFIFNCLNAIQKLIVVQDMDASYNYLSKFSKLLRLVLDNSDKNFIYLSQEIEMNKLYLELESLRFKNSFEYNIHIDLKSDPEIIQIPSLLLQPFIENAIWHGLMHKEGDKKLLIKFSEDDRHLYCSIEDNGIGRKKAASIKAQKLGAQFFNSKGTQLSEQRIQLLNYPGFETAKVTFTDLINQASEPYGTRVVIQIPLQIK